MYEDDYEWIFEDFEEQFAFIRRFQGLETLVIEMPDQRHSASLLTCLVDSISLDHNNTLRHLALLDACRPADAGAYKFDTTISRNSVYNAVMTCPHLVQLGYQPRGKQKKLTSRSIATKTLYKIWQ